MVDERRSWTLQQIPTSDLEVEGAFGRQARDLDDILKSYGFAGKREFMRAFDELTVRWAAGTVPDACRWFLNTQLLFLRKDVEGKNNDFYD